MDRSELEEVWEVKEIAIFDPPSFILKEPCFARRAASAVPDDSGALRGEGTRSRRGGLQGSSEGM
ncbi:MAG: hypothetical protein Kow00128_21830 [Deltaproteobacteria bacterium]